MMLTKTDKKIKLQDNRKLEFCVINVNTEEILTLYNLL